MPTEFWEYDYIIITIITVTCISDYRRRLDWWIDLLTTYSS
jgi:hypothetical protein